MGLFDELLKKPTPVQQATAPILVEQVPEVTQTLEDPVKIEKSEEQSIMTEARQIPSIPNAPTMVAEGDSSGLIISPSSPIIDANPVFSAEIVSPNLLTDTLSEPEITIASQPSVENISQSAPIVETTTNTSDTSTSSEQTIMSDIIQEDSMASQQVAQDTIITNNASTPEEPTNEEHINSENHDSLNAILGETEIATIQTSETGESSNLGAVFSRPNDEDVLVPRISEGFQNLRAYIESNIEQTDALKERLEETYAKKLKEASGYQQEEERMKSLKEDAYKDAKNIMIDIGHAEQMGNYFKEQLTSSNKEDTKKDSTEQPETMSEVPENNTPITNDEPLYDEPPAEEDVTIIDDAGITGSVEAALTGIAVQESVKNAVEKKHKTKKNEVTDEHNFSLI